MRPTYPLLKDATKASLRETLQREHDFFYHFTLDSRLESIRNSGIDPNYEGIDSAYPQRRLEPAKAMRFCTKEELLLGYRTALTRNSVFDDPQGIWTQGSETVVLLRVKSKILLSREFGLDHSFVTEDELEPHLSDGVLIESAFAEMVRKKGAISCYEPLPAHQTFICTTDVETYLRTQVGEFDYLRRPWWTVKEG
jgi:hypothetical protein